MMSPTRIALAALLALSAAFPARAAPDGKHLYNQHCAACHGAAGHGGVGTPLALPDFLATADDDYLEKTIRLGRPGRVMPAFSALADAEVKAIVAHIRGWAPGVKPVVVMARPGDPERGRTLYGKHCAACHGENGEGGHGTGVTFSRPRDYPILAPALNNAGFLAAASDAMIKATLIKGRQGTPMPAFLQRGLSERDIDDVVAYLRSFTPATSKVEVEGDAGGPIILRESPFSLPETVERLKSAVAVANMRLIRVEAFDKTFAAEGGETKNQVVVDACDFGFLNQALKIDPRIGLFLPCRFTVAEQDGKVLVMAVNPKRLSAIFNNAELDGMCQRMHETYTAIIEEATF